MRAQQSRLTPRADFDVQGHRGARGLMPENTLPAFRKALELGVTTLEMDVVVSADSEVVVSHEPWFSARICSKPDGTPVTQAEERSLTLYSMSYEEIARFDCGSRTLPEFPGQRSEPAPKPLLREVIRMAESYVLERRRPPVRYNIETKSRRAWDGKLHPEPRIFTELLRSVLAESGVLGRSTIQSFDLRTLREARRLEPGWSTSLLAGRVVAPFLGLNLRRLGFIPDIYSPHYLSLSGRMIRRAHEAGMHVIPWTLNTEEAIEAAVRMGVDGLISDFPDRVLRVLEQFLDRHGRGGD